MVQTSILAEVIKMALSSIWSHKLRTFLTLLGIIVGVASVMVVAAGISGAEEYVIKQVSQALGSNSFILVQFAHFGNVSDEDWKEMRKRNRKIEFSDLEFLRRYCTDCARLTAELSGSQTTYVGNEELRGTNVQRRDCQYDLSRKLRSCRRSLFCGFGSEKSRQHLCHRQ